MKQKVESKILLVKISLTIEQVHLKWNRKQEVKYYWLTSLWL